MNKTNVNHEGIILLHGLCRRATSMNKLQRHLERSDYIVVNQPYPSTTAPIAELSEMAIGGALQDARLRSCKKIHYVTHSLGGILVRDYYQHHPHDRLGRVVMLAPPNQGSEVVDRIGAWRLFQRINGPAGNELGTDASSLPNQLGAVNFATGIIAGDRSINQINSLMIKGTNDGKVSVERTKVAGMTDHCVIHTAHPFIMKNKTAIALTLRFLQTGRFFPR